MRSPDTRIASGSFESRAKSTAASTVPGGDEQRPLALDERRASGSCPARRRRSPACSRSPRGTRLRSSSDFSSTGLAAVLRLLAERVQARHQRRQRRSAERPRRRATRGRPRRPRGTRRHDPRVAAGYGARRWLTSRSSSTAERVALPRSPDRIARMRAGAAAAVEAGHAVLVAGGSALDAVEAAVRRARGRAGVQRRPRRRAHARTATVELDAAVMDGTDRRAGAVASVRGRPPSGARRPRGDGGRTPRADGRRRRRSSSRARPGSSAARRRGSSSTARKDEAAAGDTVGAVARDAQRPAGGGDLDRRLAGQAQRTRRRLAADRLPARGPTTRPPPSPAPATARRSSARRRAHEVDALMRHAGLVAGGRVRRRARRREPARRRGRPDRRQRHRRASRRPSRRRR